MLKFQWALVAFASLGMLTRLACAEVAAIAPFVDAQTTAIIHVDLSNVDMNALAQLHNQALQKAGGDAEETKRVQRQASEGAAKAQNWIDAFKKAGGKDLYVTVSALKLMSGGGVVLVPVEPGVDAAAIQQVFKVNEPNADDPNAPGPSPRMRPRAEVLHNCVVFGTQGIVDSLKDIQPAPRPDLTDALAAGGDSPLKIAISVPSLRVVPFIGAFFMPAAWQGAKWALIAATPPPQTAISAVIQCKDADSANALAQLLSGKLEDLKNNPGAQQNLGNNLNPLAESLKPVVDGSKVTMTPDISLLDDILGSFARIHGPGNQ